MLFSKCTGPLGFLTALSPLLQAYQRLQIQQQMLQAQRNVSGPMRQQEQQVGVAALRVPEL